MTDEEIRDLKYELAAYKGTVNAIRGIMNIKMDGSCDDLNRVAQCAMISVLVNRKKVGGDQ